MELGRVVQGNSGEMGLKQYPLQILFCEIRITGVLVLNKTIKQNNKTKQNHKNKLWPHLRFTGSKHGGVEWGGVMD